MPSVRLASALVIAGTAVLSFLALWEYRSLVDYCEGSREVAAGGDNLSCLEPYHWFSVAAIAGVLLLLEVAVWIVFGAAIVRRREQHG